MFFFYQGQKLNILSCIVHTISVMPTQLCYLAQKHAIHDVQPNEHSHAPIKLYLWILKLSFI